MEDYKEKSKVEMSLKDYLEITETQKKFNEQVGVLKTELFKGFELDSKGEVKYERYNISSQRMHNILREVFPTDYEIMVKKTFKQNSDEEDD
jgi:hypothetical protein